MPHTGRYTVTDLATMPDDGQRYEVIGGELFVTPAPGGRHQMMVMRLIGVLLPYLTGHRLAHQLLAGPADITLAPDSLVQPDLLVVDTSLLARSQDWTDVTTLFLVIEIVSPSTARADRTVKRRAYQQHGVPEYWVVDPEERQVEVWMPYAAAPMVNHDDLRWQHPMLEASVTIDLPSLFDFD